MTQKEAIEALLKQEGKTKGVKFGRPEKNVECVLLDGETVRAACRRLGISKTYWYEQKKKIDLPSAKSTSRPDGQTQKEGIAAAKAKGVKFGRPEKNVECVLLDGETVRAACRRLGISKTYWYEQKSIGMGTS
jgi:transposase-like protein